MQALISRLHVSLRDAPLLIVCAGVLLYLVARAISVSFSWDEAYTYLHHVRPGVLWPERFDEMGANHHLLNVWGMWLADRLLGPAEWMLRLPNVLAGALYLGAAFSLVRAVRPWPVSLCMFLLLAAHPYMLDMFSLARGYGLGMAFMMLSLVFLRKYAGSPNGWTGVQAVLAAGVASLSNLLFLNFLLAMLASLSVLVAQGNVPLQRKAKVVLTYLAAASPFLALNAVLGWRLSSGGSLYFGSADLDTALWSVAIKVFYHLPHYVNPVPWFQYALAMALVVPFLTLFIGVIRRRYMDVQPLLAGVLVLVFWAGGLAFEHFVLGTPWPHARTGVAIMPLAAFLLVTALMNPVLGRYVGKMAACVLVISVIQLQARAFNLDYCIEWRVSGQVRDMFNCIREDMAGISEQRPVYTVLSGFESYMPLRYYAERNGKDHLVIEQMRNGEPILRSDHYIVEFDASDKVDSANWTLRFDGAATNTRLFRDVRNMGEDRQLAHVQLGTLGDMGWNGDRKLFGEERFGGRILYVFDERTALDPRLVVDMQVLPDRKDDWISFDLTIRRQGQNVESRSAHTSEGPRTARWERLSLAFGPSKALMPGDTLELTIWGATGKREQWVKQPELRVYVPNR
jgi:hypothetical protein